MTYTWKLTTEERYDEMLGVLPPEVMTGYGFLVGEPFSHRTCRVSGEIEPTFDAFMRIDERYFVASEPLTRGEFHVVNLADVKEG